VEHDEHTGGGHGHAHEDDYGAAQELDH
jgi:hypothetical protein